MAHDDRHRDEPRSRREAQWRGDDNFGSGRGNPGPRPQRLGDRSFDRPSDDPDFGAERYGGGDPQGYGAGNAFEAGGGYGGPGFDSEFGGPRFDRADVGSTGTHGVHPVSSAFGGGYGAGGYGSSARRYAMMQRQDRSGHDPHYSEWRNRQIEQLDRDYDEYRREHQSRFDREFGAWRERRGLQREAVGRVREHMEVVGSDGSHVGTVDCTKDDRIVLTKSDDNAGGVHHMIPCGWVERVDEKVELNLTAEEALSRWKEEGRSRALFEREDQGSPGPHALNRSFSGTYKDED